MMREVCFLAALAGIVGMVRALFGYAAKVAAGPSGGRVENRFRDSPARWDIDRFPALFVLIFDAVFGRRRFSLRCLLLSFLASTLVSVLLFFLLQPRFRGTPLDLFNPDAQGRMQSTAADFGFILLVVVFCGLIPGYLSLLATRGIIGHATRWAFSRSAVGYLAADFIATLFIMFVSTIIYMSTASHLTGFLEMPMGEFIIMVMTISKDLMLFDFNSRFHFFYAIPFYAIFWSSFWMWLSLCAAILSPPLSKARANGSRPAKILFGANHEPVKTIGRLAVIVLLIIFAVATLFVLT